VIDPIVPQEFNFISDKNENMNSEFISDMSSSSSVDSNSNMT
jgi:hypothetical protein